MPTPAEAAAKWVEVIPPPLLLLMAVEPTKGRPDGGMYAEWVESRGVVFIAGAAATVALLVGNGVTNWLSIGLNMPVYDIYRKDN